MYVVELTPEQQTGYDDQAAKSGMSVQDNIQRIVAGYGDGYFKNITQAEVKDMVEKIISDPSAYKQAIQDVYDAKVAAEALEVEKTIIEDEKLP